jgi:predicted GIY-YIG superfamily endonuclease
MVMGVNSSGRCFPRFPAKTRTGCISDLTRRVWEHKIKAIPGFTAKYDVDRPVWFELHGSMAAAADSRVVRR